MKNYKLLAVVFAFLLVGQAGAVETTNHREDARVFLKSRIDQGDSVHKIAQDLLSSGMFSHNPYLGILGLSQDRSFQAKNKSWSDEDKRNQVKDADVDSAVISTLASDVLDDYRKSFGDSIAAMSLKETLDKAKFQRESAEKYWGGDGYDDAEFERQSSLLKWVKELMAFKKPEVDKLMAELKSKLDDIRSKAPVSNAEQVEKNEDIRVFENTIEDLRSAMSG